MIKIINNKFLIDFLFSKKNDQIFNMVIFMITFLLLGLNLKIDTKLLIKRLKIKILIIQQNDTRRY
jgi:hypothetical protein